MDGKQFHRSIRCDGCTGSISGARYKCMQCPDFDLCSACELQLLHPEHLMLRVSHLCIDGLQAENSFDLRLANSGENFFCDGCDSVSTGPYRYKCLQCPDLNLCTKCEQRGHHRHLMVRLSRERLKSFSRIYHALIEKWFSFHFPTGSLNFKLLVTVSFSSRAQLESGDRPQGVVHADSLCLICCDNVKNTILRPCKHASTCESCTKQLKNKCPICQATFFEFETFFM